MEAAIRIVTLCLNAAVDRTLEIPGFTPGQVNRVAWEAVDAGGKAINVASFLADAGLAVTTTGFLGDVNAEPFDTLFGAKGIRDCCVRLPGSTRVNLKIVDPTLAQVTEINLPGLRPGTEDLARLFETIDALIANTDWFVLSGSVPAGVPAGIYADLIDRLKVRGKRVLLDTSGDPFRRGVARGPDVVKPNRDELCELLGRPLETHPAILDAARNLIDSGVGLVAVSMGAEGALFAQGDEAVLAVPPAIPVASTVGAGDAMVAGILVGTARGLDLPGLARIGTAFSVATLGLIGPHLPAMEVVEALAAKVRIGRPGR